MKRRNFLIASAGAASAPGWAGIAAADPRTTGDNSGNERIQGQAGAINQSLVANRNQNRSTIVSQNGAVATSHPLACVVGLDVLKAGGNAIDAAIAMNAMIGLVEPASCGPGGDLFAIVWDAKEQRLLGLNASGRSPYDWSIEAAARRGYTEDLPELGPHSWSVPGCVSGWDALHRRLGSMPIADLLAPSVEYARKGFPITEVIAGSFRNAHNTFADSPNGLSTFVPGGVRPEFGQLFRNPDMGDFFDILIRDGLGAFYEGEIAERIVQFSQERGGYFSLRDFADHRADWVDPVSTSYRGYDVWELPPNGQGIAVLQMLNMLEHFDFASIPANSAEHLHLIIEAKKLAFEDRSVYYADMEKADVPLEWLISKEYAAERVKLIDPRRAASDIQPGDLDGSSDTIYQCTADAEGNMVSLIQSIYWGWGSREVPTGLGFPLQNRGRSFKLDPSHRNALAPHKRPFHTIIPAFVTRDGHPKCAFGVMGGDFQPQGHVQILLHLLEYSLSIQQAGEQPRVIHTGSPDPWGTPERSAGRVGLEAGFAPEVAERLIAMGHHISELGRGRHGGYQAIWREDDPLLYFSGSDPRLDGLAIGY